MNSNTKISPTAINHIAQESKSDYHWYALYTKSRFEKKVYQELNHSKFQVFLPLVKEKKAWSDRIKTVTFPLLPGYVFVKFDQRNIPKFSYYRGIVRIVSFEGRPCEVREEEIRLLEQIIAFGFPVHQVKNCVIGDKVRIVRGPLQGWEGNVVTTKGQSRIVFNIASIFQVISVEVNLSDVELIN